MLLLLALTVFAAFDQAPIASAILGSTVLLLSIGIFEDCGKAMGCFSDSLENIQTEMKTRG